MPVRPVSRTCCNGAVLATALLLWLAGTAIAPVAAAPVLADAGPWDLTVFHTNDIHGSFLPEPAAWRDDRAPVGGFAALAAHLGRERQSAGPDLLLDAGDFMTGNPVTDIETDGIAGLAMAEFMGAAGYDVGVVGNHEFDGGLANLRALASRWPFPLLAADLRDAFGNPVFRTGPLVLERGGLRVGVMGVSCAGLAELVPPSRLAGVTTVDQIGVVREQLADLVGRTDLQVLISHSGVDADRELAAALAADGLDVIVGGHSHTRLREPLLVGDVLIVQAGSRLKNLGRLDLRVADGRVTAYRGSLVELTAGDPEAPPAMAALVDRYARQVEAVYGVTIGHLATAWTRNSGGESNLGDWLADRLRERAGADVALVNSGGIRKGLPAGPITRLDIEEMLPFANLLVTVKLSGADLERIVRANARAAVERSHGILQVAGLRYRFRTEGGEVVVTDLAVGGRPVVADRTYTVALPDYVATMADVYLGGVALPAWTDAGVTLTEAIVDAVKASPGAISSETDGRIQGPRG